MFCDAEMSSIGAGNRPIMDDKSTTRAWTIDSNNTNINSLPTWKLSLTDASMENMMRILIVLITIQKIKIKIDVPLRIRYTKIGKSTQSIKP